MAIAVFSQWPQAPTDTSRRVAEGINQRLGGKFPEGGLYHAEGPTDEGGWWTFNVWESEEIFQRFDQEILQSVLQEVNAPPAEVRRLQVSWDTSRLPGQG
jgi:hypothetical protein